MKNENVRAAVDGGEVRPAEQHIHSFLESLPFMAMSALLCLHWDQIADVWQGRADPRHGGSGCATGACPPVTCPTCWSGSLA